MTALTIQTEVKLPDKMSDLIELALADLEKTEQMADIYQVDMSAFHSANGHCRVCFAGAVMAQTLGSDPKRTMYPAYFPADIANKLDALDNLRCGYLESAYCEMTQSWSRDINIEEKNKLRELQKRFGWPIRYHHDATAFKSDMRRLATMLRAEGF